MVLYRLAGPPGGVVRRCGPARPPKRAMTRQADGSAFSFYTQAMNLPRMLVVSA